MVYNCYSLRKLFLPVYNRYSLRKLFLLLYNRIVQLKFFCMLRNCILQRKIVCRVDLRKSLSLLNIIAIIFIIYLSTDLSI